MNKLQGKKTETDSSGFSVLFRLKKNGQAGFLLGERKFNQEGKLR